MSEIAILEGVVMVTPNFHLTINAVKCLRVICLHASCSFNPLSMILRSCKRIYFLSVLLLFAAVAPIHADIKIGDYILEIPAFADVATQIAGQPWTSGCFHRQTYRICLPPESGLAGYGGIGIDAGVHIDSDMIFQLDFTDNIIVNQLGSDLVIFDAAFNSTSGYSIAVRYCGRFGSYLAFPPDRAIYTGVYDLFWYNFHGPHYASVMAIEIDLDDFGIVSGGIITSIRFRATEPSGANPMSAAALPCSIVPVESQTWGRIKSLYQ